MSIFLIQLRPKGEEMIRERLWTIFAVLCGSLLAVSLLKLLIPSLSLLGLIGGVLAMLLVIFLFDPLSREGENP